MAEFEVICEELDISAGKKILFKEPDQVNSARTRQTSDLEFLMQCIGIYGRCCF